MPRALLSLTLALGVATAPAAAERILVFSKTAGFRHASIPDGIAALRALGAVHDFEVEATEDATWFTDDRLATYDAVVFLSTTGDVLDAAQERAFERYIRRGGAFVGIHAASDTEYDWPWFGGLVGAYFKGHPAVQRSVSIVEDRAHPSTEHLPQHWERTDEWYDFRDNPRGTVHVLMRLDESTYSGGTMGHDHPIAWCHDYDGGRAWYTGGGHTSESFAEPAFRAHLRGGIEWAIGRRDADVGATVERYYERVLLDDDVADPMELAIARDGRVFLVERGGVIKCWQPDTERTEVVGVLDVFTELEDGLLGITLDPSFDETGWCYLYYAPRGTEPENVLARFTIQDGHLDPGSEVRLLRVRTQRDECCHSGGSLTFDAHGNLYLSTGDNTNPFASDGYAPIDERRGRSAWDAQRSSANTHDLRGKILRITPQPDGTYTIPDGNLFPADGTQGRPEIYVMGCRNPFRISVDPETDTLYWGDVGPDAASPRDGRGARGHDEFNRTTAPGFFGWPYAIGANLPYHDYDFDTQTSDAAYDLRGATNHSPNNTGADTLPPAQPAWIPYPYAVSDTWPSFGSGERCAMAGPTVHHDRLDPAVRSPYALPAYYDDALFLYEWSRDWIKSIHFDDDRTVVSALPFLDGLELVRPMDLELGPDGRLYLIEWGTGFGGGNRDARVSRIDYYPTGARPPRAVIAADRTDGALPLRVTFSGADSIARDPSASGDLTFAWDCDGDGTIDARTPDVTWTYAARGRTAARLTVTDSNGLSSHADRVIVAGNTRPVVTIDWPPAGAVVAFGDAYDYRATVTDADGAADAARLQAESLLGHDTHAHPMRRGHGATGSFDTLRDDGHGGDANVFTVLTATYTDDGTPPLTGRAETILQPHRVRAEHAARADGVTFTQANDAGSDRGVVHVNEAGGWIAIDPVHLTGITAIQVRIASGTSAAAVELRLDAPDGAVLGRAEIAPTGGQFLPTGPVPFRVEYFEKTGGAGVILRASGPDTAKQIVPPAWFTDGSGEPGVRVSYYALDPASTHGDVNRLPDFTTLTPYATHVIDDIALSSTSGDVLDSGRADHVGVVFEGDLEIPADGRYSFWLESDDGSRLFINGERVIDNDGTHAMVERQLNDGWRTVTIPVTDPGRTFALYLVDASDPERIGPIRWHWIEFIGDGAATERAPAPRGGGHGH